MEEKAYDIINDHRVIRTVAAKTPEEAMFKALLGSDDTPPISVQVLQESFIVRHNDNDHTEKLATHIDGITAVLEVDEKPDPLGWLPAILHWADMRIYCGQMFLSLEDAKEFISDEKSVRRTIKTARRCKVSNKARYYTIKGEDDMTKKEILSYFAEDDPALLPYARQAMEELPGLRELYDVEDVAGEMLMSGCTPADALARLKRDGNAVAVELANELATKQEPSAPIVEVDMERTLAALENNAQDAAVARVLAGDPEMTARFAELAEEKLVDRFHGMTLDPEKEKKLEEMNHMADIVSAVKGVSVAHYAQPSPDGPNSTLVLQVENRAFISGHAKKAFARLHTLADDCMISAPQGSIRLIFGLKDIWSEFEEQPPEEKL